MRPVGSAEELERRRRRAIALFEHGEKPAIIIRVLGITRTSFHRWRNAAMRGEDGLSAKARERHTRLSPDQFAALAEELEKGPAAHGWPGGPWTGERGAALIERLFQVRYSPDHVRMLLREKLGWRSRKSEKRCGRAPRKAS